MIGGGVGALGYQLYWGEITAGTMAAAAALLDSVRTQLSTFTETLSIMLDKWRGSIRLVRLVEREEDGVLRSQTFPVNWSKIECQRLDYSFGEKKVLKSFSLSLQRGEWVILQGASGAGKSTLVELLCRVRNPTAGMILFDQIPLSTITESEVRKNIALVLQQGMIFTATFRENLTLQSVTAAEDLLQVLKIVELDILVESLPMKLDTEIFEGGENFSGGEKQRIMIGRALLKNPSLLVLDESTAMIGAQQEESILTNIRANFPGMTVILVSHKSDAKKFADRVITL